MTFMRRLSGLALLWLLLCHGAAQADAGKGPEYQAGWRKGVAVATTELRRGKFKVMGFGMPSEAMDKIYQSELGRYGVSWEPYGHSMEDSMAGYVEGFNSTMEQAIAIKHGADIHDRIRTRIARRIDALDNRRGAK
jgi:hypothetical protein